MGVGWTHRATSTRSRSMVTAIELSKGDVPGGTSPVHIRNPSSHRAVTDTNAPTGKRPSSPSGTVSTLPWAPALMAVSSKYLGSGVGVGTGTGAGLGTRIAVAKGTGVNAGTEVYVGAGFAVAVGFGPVVDEVVGMRVDDGARVAALGNGVGVAGSAGTGLTARSLMVSPNRLKLSTWVTAMEASKSIVVAYGLQAPSRKR